MAAGATGPHLATGELAMVLAEGARREEPWGTALIDDAQVEVELLVELGAQAAGPDGLSTAGPHEHDAHGAVGLIDVAVKGRALATNHAGLAAEEIQAAGSVGSATAKGLLHRESGAGLGGSGLDRGKETAIQTQLEAVSNRKFIILRYTSFSGVRVLL